ncbi:ABC transporter ATP-binding protein [Cryobacterium sp. TMT1-21]|uniref:ABC transporter ATP-binding protein n=1 Tax=Cryobacterium shii TaxID=1259235 RepID=A0AAQ2HEI8_9MICO|nr:MULTISPECIES: ABC transporter ATP-binding protein [Cryobacterium]TFC42837.1 ABC transporter ATP-binding protein [Cryobacterium shii]TFC89048.1 ABC transporter ATP-binding protein [Cryobacterium sp. TmT2-59]TFD15398.1 ABC transporter ATP-binding protein [Cryobacterium sp. TMT1-21]TFD22340.1 ABC transporter ATP-binding protein [Cryobacterium sp. TMT2-23]TFD40940.1 ABC transporter ATP-binding protein [Cryobacterium sp. TMT2-10]
MLRLYPFARPAVPRLALGMLAALLAALVALAIPQVLQRLVDGTLSRQEAGQIWPAVLLILGLGVIEAVLIALRRWFVLGPGTHIEARMRNALYARLQDLPVSFHDKWPSGQLLSRMVSDLNLIRRWISFGLVLLVVNVVTILIGAVILVSMNWVLGVIFLVCSVPLWVVGYLFEGKYSAVARRSQDQAGDLATAVEESVHGIRVLKAFGRGKFALKNFSVQAESLRGTEIEKARAIAGIWLWLLMVPDVAFALCLVAGVWLASQNELSVGSLVAFFATATVLRWPVESIGFLLSMTFDTRTATDRFFDVLDAPNSITDPEHPVTIDRPRGRLAFTNVHFRYPDSPARFLDLLDGVDLVLEPGETMALVGLTGCGKSTLTALTTRLYDVTEGAVTLDGVDVRDLGREELRRHLSMAFEDATLFSASVRDNVLLGRPEWSERSIEADAALEQALQVAQAGFAHDLPQGVDTLVGEEGMSLSGGQRQRIALARAVAARPAVLVLDDPLSALDVDTEALVEAALREVLSSTTALIVAHRPSTVMLADRVALLENGRITAVGRHSDLLRESEHYKFVISSLEDEERRESLREEVAR